MDLTIVKYRELENPNICTIMAISDCDELYRIEKVYRNDRYNDNYHIGKLLDIRDDKLYQNKVPTGTIEKIELDSSITELIKTQIQLEQDISRKKTELKHIDELLFTNNNFISTVYQ
jgi:hypothetical protein